MDITRLIQAASALSAVLYSHSIRHAFYGSLLPALLAKNPASDVGFVHGSLRGAPLNLEFPGDHVYRRRWSEPSPPV